MAVSNPTSVSGARASPGPRLLLALLPAAAGTATWGWLQEVTGDAYPYGLHPLWIYLWHPPLMDVLFGAVVLASFIQVRHRWWLRAALLGLCSFLVHTIAVMTAVDTQWLMSPLIDVRFLSVVPIALIATIVLTNVAAALCGLTPNRRLQVYSAVAGVGAGVFFVLALEFDTFGDSWILRSNAHWMFWHASICSALHYGGKSPDA